MNEIVNKVLLKGGKLVPEIHLQQLGFLNSILGWKGKITYPFFFQDFHLQKADGHSSCDF